VATAIGLTKDVQGDFSGGSFPSYLRDEIPESALEDALNCLIDDNGLPYLRGGSSFLSSRHRVRVRFGGPLDLRRLPRARPDDADPR
jgi:hypothetical protein